MSVSAATARSVSGKVDALLGAQARAAGRHVIDLDLDALGPGAQHAAADLAVVEPDALAVADPLERGGQGAVHVCRLEQRAVRRQPGCGARPVLARQHQAIVALQADRLDDRRQIADRATPQLLAVHAAR